MSVSFKAFLYERSWRGDPVEIRRFNVDQDVSTSYTYLLEKISQVFPTATTGNVSLAWTDTDGDLITISSDEELVEALDQFDGTLFKLYLLKRNTGASTQTTPEAGSTEEKPTGEQTNSQSGQRRHWGVVCDGCNGPISGVRYKCLVCDDYDLCSGCEGKGVHVDHNMLTITDPGTYSPWGFHGWGGWGGPQGHCGRRGGWRGRGHPCHGRQWGRPPFAGFSGPSCPLWGVLGGAGGHCTPGQGCGKPACGPESGKSNQESAKEQPGAEPMDTEQPTEEQRRAHIRNIGQAVSSFLQPFGIKVDVDVAGSDESKTETGATGGASATPEVSSEVIEQTLAQLKSMGYEDDEGGWLTELVKAKGGDISKVLDALNFTETD